MATLNQNGINFNVARETVFARGGKYSHASNGDKEINTTGELLSH